MTRIHQSESIARQLGKPTLYIKAIKSKFNLPEPAADSCYSPAYVAFLEAVVALRTFGIGMDEIYELFQIEKKLLVMLKIDTVSGSPTWYLDQCDKKRGPDRLLLTNYPLGGLIADHGIQSNLDFSARPAELFKAAEMGEDARKILALYRDRLASLKAKLNTELPVILHAVRWVRQI